MANPPKQGRPKALKDHLRYVDRPEIRETFVDEIGPLISNGGVFKIEMLVHRINEPKPGDAAPSGTKVPSARLVLSPAAAIELMNAITKVRDFMLSKGMITLEGEEAKPTGTLQ